ncbi:hypothetical protein [Actinokineospora sp. NBRC 105648]|uniref:sunset domain-containing protein n=1 Tax=Actinokineospora sp. NBRC 105648 TaxID=3032206 RepID=UPI0024A2A608|nr:hypothetical protein [Actinokineospora sp. NBRC 105648]GLZ40032.1 hypothetical protein Acsp05_36560 [Actinokineospora sp. NBRC 105648]
MRRPVLWCVLSFLLGAAATWWLRSRQSTVDDKAWVDDTPTGRIPVLADDEVTRHSGTLDDALHEAAAAGPDGLAPSDEYTVKGIQGVFHTTESPDYPQITATVWFKTVTDAERAGFVAWNAE